MLQKIDGEMGRWGDREMGRFVYLHNFSYFILVGDGWKKLSFEQEVVRIQESGEKLDFSLINKSGNFLLSLSSFSFLLLTCNFLEIN
ncbi:MAG: hypothetical protein F6K24_46210 [Okeania sp. SIO2D1]|nr:hypothetical protein [Okeania sp. SIO2D1]